uniref:Putative lipocalin lipocalin n=1 Tax=Rhipicephalus microplus TaxID=6941 RepID=A0A6G5A3P9_RHIMP
MTISKVTLTGIMLLLVCQSTYHLRVDVLDISRFYMTGDVIWTVKTTMLTSWLCKVDLVDNTTTYYTLFRRNHTEGKEKYTEYLNGTFITMETTRHDPPFNAMVVHPQEGGMNKSIEELQYQYDNYTCGIFSVSLYSSFGFYYELRVKTRQYLLRAKPAPVNMTSSQNWRQLQHCITRLAKKATKNYTIIHCGSEVFLHTTFLSFQICISV